MIPKLILPRRHGDARGWFVESYRRDRLLEVGIECDFVQDNHSFSAARGTLRGLHFQAPPAAQSKLVRCISGAIWDVAVDIRVGSPTYGQSVATVLSADRGEQLFVPVGFAHGFLTLTDDVEVLYKTSTYYAPAHEGGLAWDDPALGLSWPLDGIEPTLSGRDLGWPRLGTLDSPFRYGGCPLEPLCVGNEPGSATG